MIPKMIRCPLLSCMLVSLVSCSGSDSADTSTTPTDAGKVPSGWECTTTSPPVATPGDIQISLNVVEVTGVGTIPISNAVARLCSVVDTVCASGTLLATTDQQGKASGQTPITASGLDGTYIEITANEFMPLMWHFSRPPIQSFSLNVQMVRQATFATLIPGLSMDISKGHLTATVKPCPSGSAAGVVVDATPRYADSKRYYYDGGSFLADDVQPATGTDGVCAVFNLSPGSARVTASPASSPDFKISQATVVIRAGAISTIDLSPQ